MELTEPVESINNQLVDLYGIDTIHGIPIWRVVWSEEQFEKRHGTYDDFTPAGIWLRQVTEVREVPKYRQWIPEKWVLERLVIVPEENTRELPTSRLSYEPMFVFENELHQYLPPKLQVCKIVIDTIYAAMGKSSLAKYKDSNEPPEAYAARIDEIMEELFGNETDTTDALAYGEGVVVPKNYQKEN